MGRHRKPAKPQHDTPQRATTSTSTSISAPATPRTLSFTIHRASPPFQLPVVIPNSLTAAAAALQFIYPNNTHNAPFLRLQIPANTVLDCSAKTITQPIIEPYSQLLSIHPAIVAAHQLSRLPPITQPTFITVKKLIKELSMLNKGDVEPYQHYHIYTQRRGQHIHAVPATPQWKEHPYQTGTAVEKLYTKQTDQSYMTYEVIEAKLGQHNLLYTSTCDAILECDIPELKFHAGQSIEIKTKNKPEMKDLYQQYYSGKTHMYCIQCEKLRHNVTAVASSGRWVKVPPEPPQLHARLRRVDSVLTQLRQQVMARDDEQMHVYSVVIDSNDNVTVHRKELFGADAYAQLTTSAAAISDTNHNDVNKLANGVANITVR